MPTDKSYKITEITSLRFYSKCPSCGEEYELVDQQGTGCYDVPSNCPHCGLDLVKLKQEEKARRKKEIEENRLCQLRYDVIGAGDCGVKLHPQEQMWALGYTLIDSVPLCISDCWLFTVDSFIEPLPPYLDKAKYNIGTL